VLPGAPRSVPRSAQAASRSRRSAQAGAPAGAVQVRVAAGAVTALARSTCVAPGPYPSGRARVDQRPGPGRLGVRPAGPGRRPPAEDGDAGQHGHGRPGQRPGRAAADGEPGDGTAGAATEGGHAGRDGRAGGPGLEPGGVGRFEADLGQCAADEADGAGAGDGHQPDEDRSPGEGGPAGGPAGVPARLRHGRRARAATASSTVANSRSAPMSRSTPLCLRSWWTRWDDRAMATATPCRRSSSASAPSVRAPV